MKRNIAVWAAAAAALLFATPQAFAAAGTQAGTKVRNIASVSYQVGGVTQTSPADGEVDFLVDRRVDLTVSAVASSYSTTPGAVKAVSFFQVTNSTNDTIDVALTAWNPDASTVTAGPDGKISGPGTEAADNITSSEKNTAGLTLYYDNGTTLGVWDNGDTEVSKDSGNYYIEELAPDANRTIMVVADTMPALGDESDAAKVQNNDTLAVALSAEARNAHTSADGSTGLTWPALVTPADTDGTPDWPLAGTGLGLAFTEATTDTANVDTVFADSADQDSSSAAGQPGAARNGQDASYTIYTITAATITVSKSSVVYWDPINLFTDPVAIPGAMVLYCVSVANSGTAIATSVVVTDNIPANTVFEQGATDTDAVTAGVQPLNPGGTGDDGNNDGLEPLSAANSIRFSTTATCTAGAWEGSTDLEDSDAVAETSSSIGNVTGTALTTTVDSLAGGATTTTMFLVKIE